MSKLYKILLPLLLVFTINMSYGQTEKTPYKLTSKKAKVHGKNLHIESTIERVGDSLVWCQKTKYNTINRQCYKIRTTTDRWNKEQSEGEINYILDIKDFDGHFTIKGDKSQKTGVLSIKRKEEEAFTDYAFDLQTISDQ